MAEPLWVGLRSTRGARKEHKERDEVSQEWGARDSIRGSHTQKYTIPRVLVDSTESTHHTAPVWLNLSLLDVFGIFQLSYSRSAVGQFKKPLKKCNGLILNPTCYRQKAWLSHSHHVLMRNLKLLYLEEPSVRKKKGSSLETGLIQVR